MSAPEKTTLYPTYVHERIDDDGPRIVWHGEYPDDDPIDGGVGYIRADLVPKWQPIETAPRDGTKFLAYEKQDGYGVYECWWQEDFSNWSGWQDDWDSEPEPTHWMPLPPPPTT